MSETPPGPDAGGELRLSQMRAALLDLSTRIAESSTEDEVCTRVVESLVHPAFGFDGAGIFMAGSRAVATIGARPRTPDGSTEDQEVLRA